MSELTNNEVELNNLQTTMKAVDNIPTQEDPPYEFTVQGSPQPDGTVAEYKVVELINYMHPFEQRVLAEFSTIRQWYNKLKVFTTQDVFADLPDEEQEDLHLQAKTMDLYSRVLLRRLTRMFNRAVIRLETDKANKEGQATDHTTDKE